MSASAKKNIGFRLDATLHKTLNTRAATADVSPHELARQYVLDRLHEGEERAETHQEIKAVTDEVAQLRDDLTVAIEGIAATFSRDAQQQAVMQKAIFAINEEVGQLRREVALAVEALLTSAGKVEAADASAWTKENFKRS